jgi:hypothetical protein
LPANALRKGKYLCDGRTNGGFAYDRHQPTCSPIMNRLTLKQHGHLSSTQPAVIKELDVDIRRLERGMSQEFEPMILFEGTPNNCQALLVRSRLHGQKTIYAT